MRDDNPVGWLAFNAFTSAALLLVLVFFDPLQVLARGPRGAVRLAAALSVVALLLGAARFGTGPGAPIGQPVEVGKGG